LRALRNLVSQFQGAEPLSSVRQVGVKVDSLGAQPKVFEGDATHPPLYYRDMFTFLPFQVTPTRFAFPSYVMSYDTTKPPPLMPFRVTIDNVRGTGATVSLYDPMTGTTVPVEGLERGPNSVTLTMTAMDYPRVIVVDEAPGGGPPAITPAAPAPLGPVAAPPAPTAPIAPIAPTPPAAPTAPPAAPAPPPPPPALPPPPLAWVPLPSPPPPPAATVTCTRARRGRLVCRRVKARARRVVLRARRSRVARRR